MLALNIATMKIHCRTLFDCTFTGVTGNFRSGQLPFTDHANQTVSSQQDWNRSRNQQRNYETLLQIFGLRTQPMSISRPEIKDHMWCFSFETESDAVFALEGQDQLAALRSDCQGVPMTLNLGETKATVSILCTQGPDQNIWFEL